jgi:hypothetical protein
MVLLNLVGKMSVLISRCISGINRASKGNQQCTNLQYSNRSLQLCIFLFRRG